MHFNFNTRPARVARIRHRWRMRAKFRRGHAENIFPDDAHVHPQPLSSRAAAATQADIRQKNTHARHSSQPTVRTHHQPVVSPAATTMPDHGPLSPTAPKPPAGAVPFPIT
jgi:hypothetical protein